MSWVAIIFTFALVDNVILSRLLGSLPRVGVRRGGMRAAAGFGGFMAVLMAASAAVGRVLDSQVLVPLGFTLLRTPVFVFLVAGARLCPACNRCSASCLHFSALPECRFPGSASTSPPWASC